jgi:scyllo-inositol 2-dehydrogenase (NADP+)
MNNYIIIGYGNIGRKRKKTLGKKCIFTVDPYNNNSDFKNYLDVPLKSFDAAILATPNSSKYEIIKYLLSKGKHVLVEKPFLFKTSTTKKIKELNLLSIKNSAIWYTSYNHRFEPLIVKLKELIDGKKIGDIYFSNFTYGNGTSQNSVNSWRDSGYGVLEDLGSHLIDLTHYLFPKFNLKLELNVKKNYELNSLDYCSFLDKKLNFNYQCSFLVWKNSFIIDIYGELGSLHLDGLNKWGPSSLKFRKRVFPSGIPEETIYTFKGKDKTWLSDINYFESRIKKLENSFNNDIKIEEHIKYVYNDE